MKKITIHSHEVPDWDMSIKRSAMGLSLFRNFILKKIMQLDPTRFLDECAQLQILKISKLFIIFN